MEQTTLRLVTEVRHSLHIIMGFFELAGQEPLSVRQVEYLSRCRASADSLLWIANDLRELSLTDAPALKLSTFPVADAVSEVAELARVPAERKGLTLEWAVSSGGRLRVEADRELIQDSLHRVLTNAVQLTQNGQIRLSASASTDGESALLEFDIADTGCGIPEDELTLLQSPAPELPAHGLRLAVVRKRIAWMNGQFLVVSSRTAGTIVRFSIPARLDRSDTLGARDSLDSRLKLLVAEDSDESFFVLQHYLCDEGYRLARAENGAQAVQMAQAGEYDLIVMDASMPVMDGYTATRAIREWESSGGRPQRVPILLFSADDVLKQTKMGSAAGCSGYLAKPASKTEVLRAVRLFGPR